MESNEENILCAYFDDALLIELHPVLGCCVVMEATLFSSDSQFVLTAYVFAGLSVKVIIMHL